MSWLTDIAGRAEDLLNKIDQNAGVILETNKSANGTTATTTLMTRRNDDTTQVEIVVDGNNSALSPSYPLLPTSNSPLPSAKATPINRDEELMKVTGKWKSH